MESPFLLLPQDQALRKTTIFKSPNAKDHAKQVSFKTFHSSAHGSICVFYEKDLPFSTKSLINFLISHKLIGSEKDLMVPFLINSAIQLAMFLRNLTNFRLVNLFLSANPAILAVWNVNHRSFCSHGEITNKSIKESGLSSSKKFQVQYRQAKEIDTEIITHLLKTKKILASIVCNSSSGHEFGTTSEL